MSEGFLFEQLEFLVERFWSLCSLTLHNSEPFFMCFPGFHALPSSSLLLEQQSSLSSAYSTAFQSLALERPVQT